MDSAALARLTMKGQPSGTLALLKRGKQGDFDQSDAESRRRP